MNAQGAGRRISGSTLPGQAVLDCVIDMDMMNSEAEGKRGEVAGERK